jgi:cytochrome d ubiquinol oxidase subunit II
VDRAMAPVWEANNVWLVFVLVVTWTGFPRFFEAVMSTAWIALILGGLGIVLRGAAFAIRKPAHQVARRRRLSLVFGLASVTTPFLFACAMGGIASGRIPPGNAAGDPWTSWLNPTSILFGVMAVLGSAFVGAVFLASDCRRFADVEMEAYFRRRAVVVCGLLVVVAGVGLAVLHADAPVVFDGLKSGWGLVLGLLAVVAIALTALLLHQGVVRATRLSAVAAVTCLVLAWGLAQNPYLLPTSMTVAQGAGNADTLKWLVFVTVVAAVLVGPALALLYRLDLTDRLAADHDEDLAKASVIGPRG